MNSLLRLKLEALKDFQEKYPTSHVGGSIGLFLRGIDLKRDLSNSDLDITIDDFVFESENEKLKDFDERSDSNDFDFLLKKNLDNSCYVKVDIRVCPEPSFEVIEFEGVNYNVSKYRDIIFWKKKYANKGVSKHINDLVTIKSGIRPLELVSDYSDLLPF